MKISLFSILRRNCILTIISKPKEQLEILNHHNNYFNQPLGLTLLHICETVDKANYCLHMTTKGNEKQKNDNNKENIMHNNKALFMLTKDKVQ